ncbi:hypothetical protein OSTOST_05431 [Ostertagia ostertagi]
MVRLIKNQSVRQAVHNMPELTTDQLITYEDWRTAHLLLATIISAYIWSETVSDESLIIPKNLCGPLMDVSNRLGLRAIICHASACLANWKLIDPSQPFSPDNLELNAFILLESRANHWFFVVTAQVHALKKRRTVRAAQPRSKIFAPCVYKVIRAVYLKNEDDSHYLNEALCSIHDCLLKATATMKRLPEHLTPTDFYHGLRPFLQGYKALSPHEIVFEGMEELGPMAYCGASAAQSSTIQLIDAS